jgi:ADP-heptose:LPS heptosyltransferase
MQFQRILIVQTAFIGDVILATPIVSQLRKYYPDARIDFLLRKGNESLFQEDHRIDEVIVWDKKAGKYKQLFSLLKKVRGTGYDLLVNLQRFASMGFLTCFSKAGLKVGFDKNPFSFSYDLQVRHTVDKGKHEVQRNLDLISAFVDEEEVLPSLEIPASSKEKIASYQKGDYLTIAPTSVWFTKQYPIEQWIKFIESSSFEGKIYLLGAPPDSKSCDEIVAKTPHHEVANLCGKLSLLDSAALMKGAVMNFVNDSAPMHLASAMNAPVTAVYCSTVPEFGFGPLSEKSHVIENHNDLDCRPCGLHGFKTCPKDHFKCAYDIPTSLLVETIPDLKSPESVR